MASISTPEETAREILAIFVDHFKSRPDHVLQLNNFNAVWHPRGLEAEDFKPGMTFAAQQGWVEVLRNGEAFKLTALGFSEA